MLCSLNEAAVCFSLSTQLKGKEKKKESENKLHVVMN